MHVYALPPTRIPAFLFPEVLEALEAAGSFEDSAPLVLLAKSGRREINSKPEVLTRDKIQRRRKKQRGCQLHDTVSAGFLPSQAPVGHYHTNIMSCSFADGFGERKRSFLVSAITPIGETRLEVGSSAYCLEVAGGILLIDAGEDARLRVVSLLAERRQKSSIQEEGPPRKRARRGRR
jgi:hypothetical protein